MAAGADLCGVDMRVRHARIPQKHAVNAHQIAVKLTVFAIFEARLHHIRTQITHKLLHAILFYLKAASPDAGSDGSKNIAIPACLTQRVDRIYRDAARRAGMRSLRDDAMRKAEAGISTLEEVLFVTLRDE